MRTAGIRAAGAPATQTTRVGLAAPASNIPLGYTSDVAGRAPDPLGEPPPQWRASIPRRTPPRALQKIMGTFRGPDVLGTKDFLAER